MQEKYKCPWCGSDKMVYGVQTDRGRVKPAKKVTLSAGENVIHVICKECGTIVRSYVEHPENLV